MKQIQIGLAGCGAFGECHLQTLAAEPRAKVMALFDIDGDRAAALAARYNVPRICESLDELCALPELDAIDVVTIEGAHCEPVIKALGAGKDVFVEKPLATTLEECGRMVRAANASGRILMVGHTLRFETKYAMLKDEIASGGLGEPVSMHARRNRPKSLLPVYGRTHPVLENSIHDIDLMLWYTGRAVRRVRGYGRRATGGQNADTFWGVLEFEGGALGVVETIWLLPSEAGIGIDDAFQFVGTTGVANVQMLPGSLNFLRETGYCVPDASYGPLACGVPRGAMRAELAYFVDCISEGRPCTAIRPEEAMEAVRIALALIESAQRDADVVVMG